ncbi:hypothetical protein NXF25_005936 [Crotalus adamanteus]|uniref:Uncharacterized protein n=1 Tax=Crotalus adamanteus TaxID=8729 RepID=A0AAW1BZZ8_CROAD
MDFIVDLPDNRGYNTIWTVVDLFSKQAHFIPCKGLPSARRLSRLFIQHIYRLHGTPRRIISDRGLGSAQGLSSAYHPSTNGAAERANAVVERYLRSYVSFQQTDWVDLLPFAEVPYNNTVHSSTGYTPFKVVHGVEFNPIPEWSLEPDRGRDSQTWLLQVTGLWERVREARKKAEAAVKIQADKKRAEHEPFRVGDWVYLATKYLRLRIPCRKLGPKYVGPFQITKIINPVTVQLRLPAALGKVHPIFHCSLLKRTRGPASTTRGPGPVMGSFYEVQDILDSRVRRRKLQYLIHWKGYPISEATWVGAGDVNAPKLLRKFHHRCPTKPGGDRCNMTHATSSFPFSGRGVVEGAACQAPKGLTYTWGRGNTMDTPPYPVDAEIPAATAKNYTRQRAGAAHLPDPAILAWAAANSLLDSTLPEHQLLPGRAELQLTPACWGNADARTQEPSGTAQDRGECSRHDWRTFQPCSGWTRGGEDSPVGRHSSWGQMGGWRQYTEAG